ncbi:cytochrome c [Occallatibacter savannae]|uniref:cytochrome c n=1 Tax=Occallatibacter savannae TaxID=1002691 RepID=UPI000D686773|nr:cytochrome c [Occallatibacter savannae]
MKSRIATGVVSALALIAAAGCNLPGKPKAGPEVPRPEEVMSFDKLYGDNCAGCHGVDGRNGSATNLANPKYEAWIDDATLRDVIAKGEKESLMPAFALESGGVLTDQQIDALVKGMRERWKKGDAFGGDTPPPYRATHAGDAAKGKSVYAIACARCHGMTREQPGKAGTILDGSFLALVNEQTIRTTIVPGRPDIGEPDWRGHIPGRAMTDDEVTDVSAWLMSQKPVLPGQPYPNTNQLSGKPGDEPPSAIKK